MHFTLAGTEDVSISQMALSADGLMLVFVAPDPASELPVIWVQRIGSESITPIAGTQGASYPFWSPDARFIGYFANGKLWKVPVAGGNAQALAPAVTGRGGSWGSRNIIAFAPGSTAGIYRVNADGTGLAPLTNDLLTKSGADNHRWPLFLPDGNHLLYWSGKFNNVKGEPTTGIFVTDLDAREEKMLVRCHSNFSYDQRHLYFSDDHQQLVSMAFDPLSGRLTGTATVLAPTVGYQPALYRAALTAGGEGTVIYNTGVGAAMSQLTWVDRSGKVLGTIGQAGLQANPALSPDGSRVALDIGDVKADNVDIWLQSTHAPGETRFTFDPSEDVNAVWSPDGSQIAYRSVPDTTHVMVKRADGTSPMRSVYAVTATAAADDMLPTDWSPDSQQVLGTYQGVDTMWLRLVAVADGRVTDLVKSSANFSNGQFSPDGRWLAYASDETGAWEIYVTSYPSLGGKWQVSRGGGTEPRWRKDMKELFYIAPNGVLNAASVTTAQGFESGVPVPLFQVHGRAPASSTDLFTYDVAKDGQRFLVNRYVKADHVAPLNIVLNAGKGKSN
jgi:Tol biopolymer transport system component